MKPIGSNLPRSYYASSAMHPGPFSSIDGDARCDVVILGGGYTGLTAALTLAEAGKSVIVCEANHIGWGASGRNGGQVHTGLRLSQTALERRIGVTEARQLWAYAQDAKTYLLSLIQRHAIDCDLADGLVYAAHKQSKVKPFQDYAEKLGREYRYDRIALLDRTGIAERLGSAHFFGGYVDHGASHLHPLKLAFGLARAASQAGVSICEKARVDGYERAGGKLAIRVNGSTIHADHLLLCGNGYMSGIDRRIDAAIVPINSFIMATEPLDGDAERSILRHNDAAVDSRHLLNYWRKSADGRLIFGGGENFSIDPAAQTRTLLRRSMLQIYPQLADCRIDFAWGGTLANTTSRMPLLRRLEPDVWVAAGYSGLGVLMAPYVGMSVARAIGGVMDGFDAFARFPNANFPGGVFRWPMIMAAVLWYGLLDRL